MSSPVKNFSELRENSHKGEHVGEIGKNAEKGNVDVVMEDCEIIEIDDDDQVEMLVDGKESTGFVERAQEVQGAEILVEQDSNGIERLLEESNPPVVYDSVNVLGKDCNRTDDSFELADIGQKQIEKNLEEIFANELASTDVTMESIQSSEMKVNEEQNEMHDENEGKIDILENTKLNDESKTVVDLEEKNEAADESRINDHENLANLNENRRFNDVKVTKKKRKSSVALENGSLNVTNFSAVSQDSLESKCMVCKPEWVRHTDDSSLYAIDVHPSGKYFATAGSDSIIKIWDMRPVMSEEAENDPSIKRLICSLRNHAYPVTCLRFSKCGNFLASGGDDRAIFLWKRFVSSDISSWRLFGQLHGHIADIQDIVWEKNSKMLASCSVDNKVIIWSLDKMAKIKELTEHTDWVRGLAWDPLGKYLASFGADGVLCIWQTSNWSLLKKITNYFIQGQIARNYQSSLNRQVYFTRMDWNPDGTYLVASFSMDQNNIYASPVFSRDTWKKLVTFIGHRFPTTATRCSPRLFRSASDETVLYSPCAVGSMDSSVSVWVPFETRPIAVFEHFFEGTVVDIAWNVDGKSFLACSIDGSIGYFRFGKNDLKGECITDSEQREHIKRISGQIRIELPDAAGLADSSDMYLDTNDIPVSRAKRKNASLSELPDFNDFEANNSEVSMAPSHNRDALTSRLKGKKAGRSERLTTENISTVHISNKYPEDLFSELIPPSFGKKEFTFTLRDHESDQTSFDIFPDFIKNHLELSVLVDDRKGKSDMFSEYSLIALLEKDSKRWIEEIPGRVVVGCGNEHSVIVGTKDRFMYFLSAETGMRVFPGVKLPSIPVSMHLYGYKLLVLCGDGDIRVWECRDMRLESKCSLRDLADALEKNQKSKIASVYLDKSFNICAIVSGNCFMYNSSLESWICLKDSRYFKSEYAFDSEAKGLAEDSVRIGQNLTALSQTPRAIQVLQNASYLENELAVALSLNLAESYRNALISYVQFLCSNISSAFFKNRLRHICDDLLGPLHQSNSSDWNSNLLGFEKRDLLKTLLNIMNLNASCSSIASEYTDKLSYGISGSLELTSLIDTPNSQSMDT